MKKKVLVIGGCGDFGKLFVDSLKKEKNVELTIYDRFFSNSPDPKVNNIMGDCRDPQALDASIKVNDIIIHCVETMSGSSDAEVMDVNILGLSYLFNSMNQYKKQCFVVREKLDDNPLRKAIRNMSSCLFDYSMDKYHFQCNFVELGEDTEKMVKDFCKNLCSNIKE